MGEFDWSDGRRKSQNMEDGNGRVTLAVLKQTVMDLDHKIEYLTTRQERLGEQIEKALHAYSERLRYLENEQATAKEQRRQHESDIRKVEGKVDNINARSTWWDGLNSLAALIAGLLGLTR